MGKNILNNWLFEKMQCPLLWALFVLGITFFLGNAHLLFRKNYILVTCLLNTLGNPKEVLTSSRYLFFKLVDQIVLKTSISWLSQLPTNLSLVFGLVGCPKSYQRCTIWLVYIIRRQGWWTYCIVLNQLSSHCIVQKISSFFVPQSQGCSEMTMKSLLGHGF